MRSYELMTIHRPEMAETDVRARVTEIETALRTRGAELDETEFWGKRRFTYEIDHLREGYYSVVAFRSEPGIIPDIDRALALSDQVLRHKFIRTDGKPSRAGKKAEAAAPEQDEAVARAGKKAEAAAPELDEAVAPAGKEAETAAPEQDEAVGI